MRKILFAILAVFSVVLLTSFIVTADAKHDKTHPNGKDYGFEKNEDGEEIEGDEDTSNIKLDNAIKQLAHSGAISGTVQFGCDEEEEDGTEVEGIEQVEEKNEVNPASGLLVYIPGTSFMAKTGPGGEFVMSFVPHGTYVLIIEIPGDVPFVIPDVEVEKKRITDLEEIFICDCADNDGDDFYAGSDCEEDLDCDDTDETINPDADEICDDLKDNNCDGETDEDGCVSPPPT